MIGLHTGPHLSAEAAAALASQPLADTRKLLERLVAMHLVEGAPDNRYQMHDLLRVYAAERADEDHSPTEIRSARQRLVCWYLYSAYEANHALAPQRPNPELPEPRTALPLPDLSDYGSALRWCEIELPNLVTVTRTAVEIGEHEAAWKLPAGLWNFLFLRKRWSAWIASHTAGLAATRASGCKLGEAWLRNNLALALRELRRFDDARRHLELALALRQEIGDKVGEAWTRTGLGFLEMDLERFGEAAQCFRQALDLRELIADEATDPISRVGNRHGQSIALANLGCALTELGAYDDALQALRESLDIANAIDDRHGEGYTVIKISDTFRRQGHTEQALAASTEALKIRRDVGDRWGEAEVLQLRGQVLLDDGREEQAVDAWQNAQEIFDELGDPRAADVRAKLVRLAEAAG